MKHYQRVCVAIALGVVCFGVGAMNAWGQVTPPAPAPAPAPGAAAGASGATGSTVVTIPVGVKTATTAPSIQLIQDFIKQEMGRLTNTGDPVDQSLGRDNLIGAVTAAGGKASPIYLNIYTQALNAALLPLAKDADVRVRIVAAIVAAKTARDSESVLLEPALVAFIGDSNEAVALWGVKGAKYIMPNLLKGGGPPPPLAQALLVVLAKHPTGPIADEAYRALDLLKAGTATAQPGPSALTSAANIMSQLLSVRVQQYAAGIPDDPGADSTAATFLASGKMWAAMTPAQQLQVAQLLNDLIGLLGQHAQAGGAIRPELVPIIKNVGGNLAVIGDNVGNPALKAAAEPLNRVANTTSGAEVAQRAGEIHKALTAMKQFKDLKPPPTVQSAGGSAPAPAVAPASAPGAPGAAAAAPAGK